MGVKQAFTAEEWQTVGAAPFLVALYVVGASPSGPMGMLTEMLAAEKAVTVEAAQPDGLPIVREIEADLVGQVLSRDLGRVDGADESQARVLEELSRALALVTSRAPAMDSAFRAWLYRLAQHVARAAGEPGSDDSGVSDAAAAEPGAADPAAAHPGSGHHDRAVNDAESAALITLAAVLGVPEERRG
jgi:hypothetical protein